jgi:hypothetical protein
LSKKKYFANFLNNTFGGVSNVMLPLQVELPKAPTNRQVVPLVQFGKG